MGGVAICGYRISLWGDENLKVGMVMLHNYEYT